MASHKTAKIIVGVSAFILIAIVFGSGEGAQPPEGSAQPDCSSDLKCFLKRSKIAAEASCQMKLMDAAQNGYKWTGSSSDRMLSVYDLAAGTILMTGHDIQFGSPAGTMVAMRYSCIYDANMDQVSKLTVERAR